MDTQNFQADTLEVKEKTSSYIPHTLTFVALFIFFGVGYLFGSMKENKISILPTTKDASLEYQLPPEEEPLSIQEENSREALNEPTFINETMGFTLTLPDKYSGLMTYPQIDPLDPNVITAYFVLPINSPKEEGPTSQLLFGITRYPIDYDISTRGPMGPELGRSNGYAYRYFQSMDLAIDSDSPEYQVFLSLTGAQQDVQNGFKILE